MEKSVGKGAVRCTAIDQRGLAAMEAHGKRTDRTSQLRSIRDLAPLVHKGLDLGDLYKDHMKDVRQNKAAKLPILHFIFRYPPDLLEGPKVGKFEGDKIKRQQEMMDQAIAFVNSTHGGDAVFAGRFDLDEEGETIVDIFASPKYEKRTKRTKLDEVGAIWASSTKFGTELAMKHQSEIRRRHKESTTDITTPRAVGMAMQSEFASFFLEINGVALTPKTEKTTSARDRIEIEAYKEIQAARDEIAIERTNLSIEKEQYGRIERRADIQGRWNIRRSCRLDARAEDLDQKTGQLAVDRSNLSLEYADLEQQLDSLRGVWSLVKNIAKRVGKMLGIEVGTDADYRSLAKDMMALDRTVKEALAPRAEDPTQDSDTGPSF